MRKVTLLFIVIMMLPAFGLQADPFYTTEGSISFRSKAQFKEINADNERVCVMVDTESGEILIHVPIRSFTFENPMIFPFFNADFMQTDSFPVAKFRGKIIDLDKLDLYEPGRKLLQVEGDLTIKGVTQHREELLQVTVHDDGISIASHFRVRLEDHDIWVAQSLSRNIAEVVNLNLEAHCKHFHHQDRLTSID